jgi:hypothetical protein
MKIEAVGHVISTRNPETKQKTEHKPGERFDADDKEAAWLIKRGLAKKAAEEKPELAKPIPAPEPKAEPKPGGKQ